MSYKPLQANKNRTFCSSQKQKRKQDRQKPPRGYSVAFRNRQDQEGGVATNTQRLEAVGIQINEPQLFIVNYGPHTHLTE